MKNLIRVFIILICAVLFFSAASCSSKYAPVAVQQFEVTKINGRSIDKEYISFPAGQDIKLKVEGNTWMFSGGGQNIRITAEEIGLKRVY